MKKLLMGTIVALLVALSGTLSAHAITYSFQVPANNQPGFTPSVGAYDATFTTLDNTLFTFTLKASATSVPNGDLRNIQVGFQNPNNSFINILSASGSTNTGWNVGLAPFSTVEFTTTGTTAANLSQGGGNTFTGTLQLASPFRVGSFTVIGASPSNQQFAVSSPITPEMPGSVLALASMLPMVGGVVIRKRGSRKSA